MRVVYECMGPRHWYAADLAEWSAHTDERRVSLILDPAEWSAINHGTRISVSDTVTYLAERWGTSEGTAAKHVTDVIGALQNDRLRDAVDTPNNPDRMWSAGHTAGYQDGRRDAIETVLVNLDASMEQTIESSKPGMARAIDIVRMLRK